MAKLGDLVDKIVGDEDRLTTTREYYIGGEHIETDRIAVYNRGNLTDEQRNILGYQFHYPFEPGDILFMTKNPYLRKCGMVLFEGICSIATFVIRTKDDTVLDQRFLAVLMQTDDFWDYLEANKSGSVNYFITWKTLEKYEFNLPTLEEQKKIADIAWAFEKVRCAYEKILIETDNLVKARFIEMFGEPGKDEYGWGLKKLKDCCILNPRRPGNIEEHTPVSFVPMPAVSENGKIDCSDVREYGDVKKGFTYFAENDVLFAKITPCMENGKGGVAEGLSNGYGAGSTEFHVLRPIEGVSNPYWLYILTMFKDFRNSARKMMTGTGGQLRVPISFLEDYMISLPPIELQDKFEEVYRQAENSKDEVLKALKSLDLLNKKVISEMILKGGK